MHNLSHYRRITIFIALLVSFVLAGCGAAAPAKAPPPTTAPPAQAEAASPTGTGETATTNDLEGSGETSTTSDADEMDELSPEPTSPPPPDESPSTEHFADAQRAIELVAAHEEIAAFLAGYPDWQGEAWREEGAYVWFVEFFSEAADEWLGYGTVDLDTEEIHEYFVPRDLTPEEFQAGLEKVEASVFADAEVMALLGDPAQWERETWYNQWEAVWEVWFWKGLDEFLVRVYPEDDYTFLEIVDPAAFEAEEQEMLNRDQAIELAWEAEGIDQALEGVDDWTTYVEHQGGSQWTVSFVSDGKELFYVLVDIEAWEVLNTSAGE